MFWHVLLGYMCTRNIDEATTMNLLPQRKELLMEKEQQQRIDAAAEQFADAVKTSYQAVAKRGE